MHGKQRVEKFFPAVVNENIPAAAIELDQFLIAGSEFLVLVEKIRLKWVLSQCLTLSAFTERL